MKYQETHTDRAGIQDASRIIDALEKTCKRKDGTSMMLPTPLVMRIRKASLSN